MSLALSTAVENTVLRRIPEVGVDQEDLAPARARLIAKLLAVVVLPSPG